MAQIQVKRNLRIRGRMQIFKKVSQKALNHDLTLPLQSTRRELPESSGILDLQNKNISVVTKH